MTNTNLKLFSYSNLQYVYSAKKNQYITLKAKKFKIYYLYQRHSHISLFSLYMC